MVIGLPLMEVYYTKCIQIQTLKYTSHCLPCVHFVVGTKVFTESTHFCTLFVLNMCCLSVLCDLYSLYTFVYFLYSTSVAYVNLEQKCIQKV